jgi:hypothetical protein
MVALITIVALTMAASAHQTDGEFDRAFETAMQRAAPDFRLEPQALTARGRSDVYKRWTSDGTRVSVRYFVRASAESASELLQTRLAALPIPTKKIDGFGEEAYLLAPSNPDGERRIWFRRGAVVVEVAASGEDGARRFAAVFSDAVSQPRARK